MSEKQPINLYSISIVNVLAVAKERRYDKSKLKTSSQIIDFIIDQVDGRRKPSLLALTKKANDSFNPLNIRVYFCKVPLEFQWQKFFGNHLKQNDPANSGFLDFKTTKHASFICFVYDEEEIYAFTGGLGNSYIKDFVDDEFGLRFLEKVGNPDTLLIRMAKNSNVVGNVAVGQRYYRGDQKPQDEDSMGKIYNEVVGNVPYNPLFKKVKSLIFDNDSNSSTNIKAKASLAFSKSLSLLDIKDVIGFVKNIPESSQFEFSKIRALSGRRKADKIRQMSLEEELEALIVKSFCELINDLSYSDNFLLEINDAKFEEFYDANRVVIRRPGNQEVFTYDSPYGLEANDVLTKIAENDREYLEQKVNEFKKSGVRKKDEYRKSLASKYSLSFFDDEIDEKSPFLDKKVKDLVTCEVELHNTPYFKISGKWYKSSENYLVDLNDRFKTIYDAAKFDFPVDVEWGQDAPDENYKETENTYLEYLAENPINNLLVFHKILPADFMIELCDLLYWDNENVYLIHIKPSFDGAVRVLERQIGHCAKLVSEDLRTESNANSLLKKYFDEAKSYSGNSDYRKNISTSLKGIHFNDFRDHFKKRVNFVACIVDPKSKRSLANIEDFQSNIAKMSIASLYKEIRTDAAPGSAFRITEIPVDTDYEEPK